MTDADALVVGAGPAGATAAILLARAGWRVVLVEQDEYPRRKVCGECITAGSLALLDELGIGADVRVHAGPELRHMAWMDGSSTLVADFPACTTGPYRYGRVLRRDFLDTLLVDHAVAQGVVLLQPARVRSVGGGPGAFECGIEIEPAQSRKISAAVVIDAHGSWERGPQVLSEGQQTMRRRPRHASDLFAFKAVFEHSRLQPGMLPVIAVAGGYGGMVVADQGLATIACCLRRDTLAEWRKHHARSPAGDAVEALLRGHCTGVRQALDGARRLGPWLTVGPLQPGSRVSCDDSVFRIGNAAGESHPLIGEGISMALQSAALLARALACNAPATLSAHETRDVQRRYVLAWRQAFSHRLRMAALYAHIAMRPALATPARALLGQWPAILTMAARLAGKARAMTSFPVSGATT